MVEKRIRYLDESAVRREQESLERKYGMTSEAFLTAYTSGDLPHESDFVRWVALCRMAEEFASHRSRPLRK